MEDIESRLIVNPNTGEIEGKIDPGDRILKSKSIEYLKEEGRDFNKDKTFVKLYDEVIPLFEKYITPNELKYLLLIAQHVSFSDCVLRKTNNNLSEPISAREFSQMHGYNYDCVKKIFLSLKKKGVLAYVEVGSVFPDYIGKVKNMYLVNPYIYFRGEKLNASVMAIFNESGWKELVSNIE